MKSRPAQVFLLSVAVIAHQLALMRALSLARTFHFAYLVIGVALLGFGASGVALRMALPAVERRPDAWRLVLYGLSCVSLPLGYALAMALPLDLQFLLHGGSQAPLLLACVCCLFVPFFFLAFLIGMELSQAGQAIPGVYAANLWGSGLGGLAGIGLAAVVPTIRLPLVTGAIVLAALLAWMVARPAGGGSTGRLARIVAALACGGATAVAIAVIPAPRIDPYKALAGFQQLAAQGDAEALVSSSGVRAQVDVYASARLHQTLFAGIQATALPPPQIAFLLDGDLAGVAFSIAGAGEAAILDSTPQSLAYRLVDSPRVLILGEVGGTNVWLARRFGASSITVVQGHPGLVRLMQGGLSGRTGGVFNAPGVTVIAEEPRSFVEHARGTYDVIHLASPEGMPAGSGGLLSLHEDWLLTTEGIGACLRLLSDRGALAATRGIQQPPRDGIRLFGLFAAALEAGGMGDPAARLLQARNYLAVTTLVSRTAIDPSRLERFDEAAAALLLDREYFPGIDSEAIRQLNVAPGPSGASWSWYHEAARRIAAGGARELERAWAYRIDAPTDDRPYFHDFFKASSIGAFLKAYGSGWLAKLELGHVVVAGTAAIAAILAIALLLPLLVYAAVRGRTRGKTVPAGPPVGRLRAGASNRLAATLHFACIGAAFMVVEMVMLQKMTRLLGDPVVSSAAVLTAMLFFSGCGSALLPALARGAVRTPAALIRVAALAVVLVGAIVHAGMDPIVARAAVLPSGARFVVAVLLMFPVSFPLGLFFPTGMRILDGIDPGFVPMAWGINGFASVIASPLAVLLSMSLGFKATLACGLGLYAVTGAVSFLWRPAIAAGAPVRGDASSRRLRRTGT